MKIIVSLVMIAAFSYIGYQYAWPYVQKMFVQEPERRLAPPGVFFLIEKFSHVTEEGIVALHPGTKVTLVNDFGSTLKVSDGVQEFEVPREKLSNDLDIRDSALAGDHAIKAKFQTALKQLDAASIDRIEKEIADAKLKIEKLNLQRNEASTMRDRLVREFSETYKVSPYNLTYIRNDKQRERKSEIDLVEKNIKRLVDEKVDLELLIDRKEMEIKK